MHTTANRLWPACALAALLWPAAAPAQTSYAHDVEQVTASEVGPYRPEEEPALAKVAERIVELTNEFRRKEGLEPVTTDATLRDTAAEFAAYMARTDRYGHTADGRQPHERAKQQGYEYCIVSENIAYQFKTTGFDTAQLAQRFFEGWKNSPPHRENMLDPDVTETGVAVAQSEQTGVFYGVQMFGRPKSMQFQFSIQNPTEQTARYRIGERTFELPPRYTRTHTRCRPTDVELVSQAETAEGELKVLDTVRPEDGDGFQVTVADGRMQFVRAADVAPATED